MLVSFLNYFLVLIPEFQPNVSWRLESAIKVRVS